MSSDAQHDSLEHWLHNLAAEVLNFDLDDLDLSKSFLALGGDSLSAIEFMGKCREHQVTIEISDVIAASTMSQLIERIVQAQPVDIIAAERENEHDGVEEKDQYHRLQSSQAINPKLSHTALDALFVKLQSVTPTPLESVQAIGPCSPMQDNFLISQKLNSQAYQCRFILRISSASLDNALSAETLVACWAQVISRHTILRTTFIESNTRLGKFDQVVWKRVEPWVALHNDAAAVLEDEQFPTYEAYKPPHRLSIAPAPTGGIYVRLDISHALVDGQSTEVLLRDFYLAYSGVPPQVEALPYLDFTAHELDVDTEPTSAYWSHYMNNAQESHLPTTNSITMSGLQTIQARLDLPSGDLDSFCGQHGVTPVNVCQTAWGLVLRGFANSDDVCFSYVTSRRQTPLSGIQDAVGLFIDALLCRLDLKDDTPIRQVLALAALNNDPQRKSIRRWGNSVLSFHRGLPTNEFTRDGLLFEPVERATPTDYDVSLNIDIDHNNLQINLDFWESKMSRPLAESILNVFQEAIKFVLHHIDEQVQAFSPLTETQKQDLRRLCDIDHPQINECVHNLVQRMSVQQPQAPAVCAWDGDWTYAELVAIATGLSQKLVTKEGVKPGMLVGICMEKSKWAIAAFLAILKSGAAVVPVGIDDPRAEELLQGANVSIILASTTSSERIRKMNLQVVIVGTQDSKSITDVEGPSTSPEAFDSVAWVLYTSGSSGKPKGVVMEHAPLSTALLALGKAFQIGPGVRSLQFAAYTFADSIPDIFGTLVMGGCVCVPSEEERTTDLASAMHRLAVNQATLTNTVAGLLLEPSETPKLRRLILSGEKPSAAVVSKWTPHTKVINGYGQSEAAVFASCSQPITNPADAANIGLPITGRYWIVQPGDHNRLCPAGVPGELLIESPALARGYMNDAEKSASAFVENPQFLRELGVSKEPTRRMYRTGDIVRQDSLNGTFIFVGRQDTQIKIRGQRVELGEIEATMISLLPGSVNAAAVTLVTFGEQTEPKLVAALELAPSLVTSSIRAGVIRPLTSGELPEQLKEDLESLQNALFDVLPVYMVPTFFVPVTQLPVNASKKTDRRVLSRLLEAMDLVDLRALTLVDAIKQQPKTEIERQLQSLWAVVFNRPLESISIKEHFFQAGGDSVTAIRMAAAARNEGLTLTVTDIFGHPRIEDLARVLESAYDTAQVAEDDPLPFSLWKANSELQMIADQCDVEVGQIEDAYPTTPLQEGLMAITTQRSRADAYVMQRVYRVSSSVALSELKTAWERLVALTPILRTRIALTGLGDAVQIVVNEPVKWHGDGVTSLSDYLEQDSKISTEYGRPLSRVALIDSHERGDNHRYFIWTIHHCLYDGWSTVKVLELLEQLWAGQAPPPAPVPISRFIRYLAQKDERITRQFWLHHLEGAMKSRFPVLPDASYQPLPTQKIERRVMRNTPQKGEVTTSTLLRAAWAIILASYSGEQEAVMTVTLSGRNASVPGIIDLIAPTVTSVPFRVTVPPHQSISDFLRDVQNRTTSMIPFEHTGLQHIRRIVPSLGADFDPGHVFTIQMAPENDQQPLANKLERLGNDADGMQSYAFTLDCITSQKESFIDLEARFDSNVISNKQVESILAQFDHIFCQLSEYSDSQYATRTKNQKVVGDLDMVSQEDKARIRTWHQQGELSSPSKPLHYLFEEVAAKQPNVLAVSAWDGDWTYSDLNRVSSYLAKKLTALGVRANTAVGFCMGKSRYAIVAILAILKSGGTIIPLRTQDSPQQVEEVLRSKRNQPQLIFPAEPILLIDLEQSDRLQHLRTIRSLILHDETLADLFQADLSQADKSPEGIVNTDNAAFVTYTSSGRNFDKPKSVVLTHKALGLSINAQQAVLKFGPETRVLLISPFVSGTTIEDIFSTLGFGGCLCIPSEYDRLNDLSNVIGRFNVTAASITPSLAALLDPANLPSLRQIKVSIGNEITTAPTVIQRWLKHVDVYNTYAFDSYGITISASAKLTSSLEASNLGIPIVTDAFWVAQPSDYNKLSPVGAIGELLIDISSISMEYVNESLIIRPSFLQDTEIASGTSPEQHYLYRTGDLVRQNIDGSFIFVARRTEKTKTYAQRGELSEIIEHHIAAHPLVQTVRVLRLLNGKHGEQTVAFVELHGFVIEDSHRLYAISELSTANRQEAMKQVIAIQDTLRQQVPESLIPTLWIPLAKFPKAEPSEEVDISLLSTWVSGLSSEVVLEYLKLCRKEEDYNKYEATLVEQQLRQIWSEVLGIPLPDVPFNQPFLSIGGDSIAAIKVVTLCRVQGIKILLRDVVQCQCIPDLAQHCKLAEEKFTNHHLEASSVESFGWSPIQELYFQCIAPDIPDATGEVQYSQSIHLQFQQSVTFSKISTACKVIVANHPILRARFHHDNHSGWQQRIEDFSESYVITQHSMVTEEDISSIIQATQRMLDPQKGPVFAADFFELTDKSQRLVLSAHQVVIDRYSWQILLRELESTLSQKGQLKGNEKISYRTWCQLQSQYLSEMSISARALPFHIPATEWEYWKLEPSQHITEQMLSLTAEIARVPTSLVLGEANEALRSQPQDILLAALFDSFRSVFPDRKLPSVFEEGSGRQPWDKHIDISDTVGCFTTLIPLHVDLSHGDDIVATLTETKDRRRIALQQTPFYLASQFGSDTRNGATGRGDMEISFRFDSGHYPQWTEHDQSIFRLQDATKFETTNVGKNVRALAVMDIAVSVVANQLQVHFSFSRQSRFQDSLQRLLLVYVETIERFVNHLASLPRSATISDFPSSNLTAADLEAIAGPDIGIDLGHVEDILPCSPMQQGILLSRLRLPMSYRIFQTFRLRPADSTKPIDVERLIQAWRQLQARHSIMRTIFVESLPDQDEFHQIVLKSPEADIILQRCGNDQDPIQHLATLPIMKEVHGRPPIRLTILHTSGGDVYGQLETNHALADAASFEILTRELLDAYDSISFATEGSRYGTYVTYLRQQPAEDDLRFWTTLLADTTPCFLPPNHVEESASRTEENNTEALLTSAIFDDLLALNKFQISQGVTVATVFEMAWALVLSFYTNSNDVCWGGLFNGRDIPLENIDLMVGPLINQTVHFAPLDFDSTVGQAARDIQIRLLDAFEHQRSSLASIQHTLKQTSQALFNTLMSVRRKHHTSTLGYRSLVMESLTANDPTEYDVTLHVITGDSEIEVTIQHSPNFMDSAAAKRLLNHYLEVVQWLVDNPASQLHSLAKLSKGDVAQVQSWNKNVPPKMETCVHQLVQQRLHMQPDSLAVDAWDGALTSRELDEVSSRIAGRLIESAGVSPNYLVGFCMSKSKWAIAAMLGILKSGGAVVPLGVQEPLPRIESIMQNTGMDLIVVDTEQISRLASLKNRGVRLAAVEDLCHDQSLPHPLTTYSTTVASSNIAFVMHTSGSTGVPKGVIVDHGALSSSIKAWVETPQFKYGPQTRASQFTAFTFDPANHDIFSVLYSGGCVCVPSEDDRLNNLERFMRDFRITSALLTPTVSRMLDPKQLPSLQTLILAGEAMKPSDVEPWLELGSTEVINAYGPTECTICVTVSRPLTAKHQASIIGHQLGVAFWITQPDDFNYLCPIGMPGELLVEGPLVTAGYLNNAEATAASFVIDPAFVRQLGTQTGRRMYRTGDIVRQNRDGSLTFIGRRDDQIKIHGQRVESNEIENWILRLGPDLVRLAYVGLIAPIGEGSEPRIIAAVEVNGAVPRDDESCFALPDPSILLELDKLRHSLFAALPSYMVPSVIVPFWKIPVSSTGKVARSIVRDALCSLDAININAFLITAASTRTESSPLSQMELLIRDLWASVLQKHSDTIDRDDDFFRIGGDSIGAMKLVAAARKSETQISLTVADVFRHPRLSELARVLAETEKYNLASTTDAAPFTINLGPNSSSIRPNQIAALADQCDVAAENIQDAYPCSPLQEGFMAITTQRPDKYVLQRVFRLNTDVAFFKATWEKLWESLPILRTRIVPWETGSIQVVVQEPVHWQSSSSLEAYLEEDRRDPMKYGGRLCRVSVIETPGSDEKHFVWTMHHSIYDGWSIFKALEMLERLGRKGPVSRPAPMSRFIRYLASRDEETTQSFWKNHLGYASVIKFPELPVDPSYLPQSTSHATRHVIRRNDISPGSVTTSNILRAAWAILLAAYAGTDAGEAIIMVALSGRQAPVEGIEDIIAPTVATVPVRVQIPPSDSIPTFLSRVQQDAVDMIPHEHTGLQNIRRHVPELGDGLFTPAHLFTVQAAIGDDFEEQSSVDDLLSLEKGKVNDDAIQGYAFNMECTMVTDKEIDVDIWFDETTISTLQVLRVLEQFENIFQQLCQYSTDKSRLVRDLDLISPQDKSQIIAWNENVPERTTQCIHEILEDISIQQPDAPAVCAWDGDLTYRELVYTASRLAHHLRSLDSGVGPEALIGFCISKSKWAIVAAVAILQAGAGVIPLGIQHPLARIQTIVENTKARFIVTDREQADRLSSLDVRTVVIDDDLINSLPMEVPGPACTTVTAENVSWVVFTSGSTGTPKGSILEHGALASSLLKHSGMLRLTSSSRALQFAAFTFDNSISDIFATLFKGGCVCEPSEHDRVSNLAKVVWDLRVNVLSLTPTVAALLRPQDVPPIETLIVGGEPLDPNVIDIWGKSSAIINSYGPSECSILVACSRPLVERKDAPNVGLPVACCFWVVSPTDFNQLSPIGAPGELLLQGAQLGRGYINEPEKTAQAFVMNPQWVTKFPSARNQRLYRSGDLVRQNPDQSLTMLGRRDTQVKIHGQRVEIGEIESWIVRILPEVRKAAVDYIALPGRSDRMLVAALEMQKSIAEQTRDAPVQVEQSSLSLRKTLEQLRTDLRAVVPSYMIPGIFLPVTRLPLNPSSKLDRLALRAVLASMSADDWNRHLFSHASPKSVETETEAVLRRLWSAVLSLDEALIGRDDNLFDLGGDSVVAMRLTALAREAGLQLTVADIFQNPALQKMASTASESSSNASPKLTQYQPFSLLDDQLKTKLLEAAGRLPAVHGSEAKVLDIAPVTDFQAQSIAGMLSSTRMDVNYVGIDAKGPYDLEKLKHTCLALISHVESFRTAFMQDNGQFWQVVLSEYDPTIQIYDTDTSIDAFTKKFLQQEAFGSPKLGKPPLDIAIIRMTDGSDEHRILFRMSHALYDSHSLPLIWDNLMAIYRGADVKSYPSFNSYLFDLHTSIDTPSLSYWHDLLQGSEMPQLSGSHIPPLEILQASVLPKETIILPSSVATGMMPAVIVKAAWGMVLAQHSGQSDVVFAESSTGRNAVSPTVAGSYGCCVTALPFRFVVPRDASIAQLLDNVRDQQTESIRHETIGTQRIVDSCVEWNRFTSLINHQRAQDTSFMLGETEYTPSFIMPTKGFHMLTEVTIAATQGPGWLEISLSYAADRLPKEVAVGLLHDLRVAIEVIARKQSAPVSSIQEVLKPHHLSNMES
ncbi:hc-toxin synthetase [Trichoderma arundinaceum]|uniref:Hc-toxin synthetase n=1 Tax=Trichoderma arundinaceum TaxID=490622 RepID=A0A395NW60_TRIAR|nr:hc-toxin synthetase [Trichoderma arundinaceum]